MGHIGSFWALQDHEAFHTPNVWGRRGDLEAEPGEMALLTLTSLVYVDAFIVLVMCSIYVFSCTFSVSLLFILMYLFRVTSLYLNVPFPCCFYLSKCTLLKYFLAVPSRLIPLEYDYCYSGIKFFLTPPSSPFVRVSSHSLSPSR